MTPFRPDPALPTREEVVSLLQEGYRHLLEEEPLCVETWDGPCIWEAELGDYHVCTDEIGHEGAHICPCGAVRP